MKKQSSCFLSLRLVGITFFFALHIGCGDTVKRVSSEEASQFMQQSTELKYGMKRDQVHSMIGIPFVSSDYLKFDIFENVGEATDYYGSAGERIRMFGTDTNVYIPMLFVIYNDDWTVKGYERSLYRESHRGESLNALIELDNYTLYRTTPSSAGLMLLAPPEISEQAILEPILEDNCALYVIVPDQPMEDKNQKWVPSDSELFLNGKPFIHPYHFPSNSPYFISTLGTTAYKQFIAIVLPEGVYEIELRGSNGAVKGSAKNKFTCVGGTTIFADIRVDFIDEGWLKWKYRYRIDGEIYITNHWPSETKIRRQVLMHRDEWYGLDYQK